MELALFSFILIVAGILFIIYPYVPTLLEKVKQWQVSRAHQASLQLEDAFVFVDKKRLYRMAMISFFALGMVGFFMFGTAGAVSGACLGVLLPNIMAKMMLKRRTKKFHDQLIDTLMIISSCLKGGLTLVQSFENVMEEMPPPIADEFGLVVRETKVGVSLEESLRKLNDRMRSPDTDLIISSILVARETGGDLTKVFSRLIGTIRDRMEIKEMTSTLTLQGRIQGIIMSLIPVIFVIVITKFNPGHFETFLDDEIGRALLTAAGIMQIMAFILIKKFSTVKI